MMDTLVAVFLQETRCQRPSAMFFREATMTRPVDPRKVHRG
jgi:hypothetical protein